MKAYVAAVLIALSTTAACASQRQVEVKTGTQPVAEVSLRITNNLTQAVNVYVTNAGSDIFLKQVAANSTEAMTVPGVPAGATVMLKATPVDGSKTYTRDNVTLTASYDWTVP